MNRYTKIARAARSGPGMRVRRRAYGSARVRQFLRDVIGLANAPVDGPRHIVVGTDADVPESDFSGNPPYAALIGEFIEPALKIRYEAVMIDDRRLGVFEIGTCHDRPYMMRIDHSDQLRRGDAFIFVNGSTVKIGRNQLQSMFESRFRDAVSAQTVEVGFPAEIIRKELNVETVDLATLPSTVARRKLQELIDAVARSKGTGATSRMVRLTHARLFGSDSPYRNKTTGELIEQMQRTAETHRDADAYYLFEERACKVQLVVSNQSSDPLKGASLTLVMPLHRSFYVADRLPRVPHDGEYSDRSPLEVESYPPVTVRENKVRVSIALGDIPGGTPVTAFQSPLRVSAASDLKGRRIGIHYELSAGNLREPATGKLRLLFRDSP